MTTLPPTLIRFEAELEQAIRRQLGTGRPRRAPARRRVLHLAAAAAAAAAVALGILSTLPGDEPSIVARAVAALSLEEDTILHFRMVGRQRNGDGSVVSWRSESWQERAAPYARRSIEVGPERITAETTMVGQTNGLYDARTNTIYVGGGADQPALEQPTPTFVPGPRPGTVVVTVTKVWLVDGKPKPRPTKVVMNTDAAKRLVARHRSAEQAPPAPVEEPFREEILRLLNSGRAVPAGPASVDGRKAIRIVSADGHSTYVVDARTYAPIEWTTNGDGASVTLRFPVYEELPVTRATRALLSLEAQHPTARINRSDRDYEAAQARLFPNG